MRARVIAGVDVDWSPGFRREFAVSPVRAGKVFEDYTRGDRIYDYDVTFRGVSPYVQLEASPVERVRVVGGLRYDHLGYDYDTALDPLDTGSHRRPASTSVSYDHLSPKLGLTVELNQATSLFAAYGHGFRAPSEGQLFRQGSSVGTIGLEPVKADNLEAGLRGRVTDWLGFELAAYHMTKSDDLLSYTRDDGVVETVNAGETLHRGLEAGLTVAPHAALRLDVAWAWQRHTYEEWLTREGVDFGGNEMEDGPRQVGSAAVVLSPAAFGGGSVGAEVVHVGSYWMDPANTHRYDGHSLLTLRADVPVTEDVAVFARLTNALDERYAENAAYTAFRGEEYAPGMPRALYFGVRYR
jgi:outer membrane receptor protein involved in Fe transport